MGVADIMARHRFFAAYVTFSSHGNSSSVVYLTGGSGLRLPRRFYSFLKPETTIYIQFLRVRKAIFYEGLGRAG
jgi:hypothetical protein